MFLFSFVGAYEKEVFDITHHVIAGRVKQLSIMWRRHSGKTRSEEDEEGKRMREEGIRKITVISVRRMEDIKGKGGLQKVVRMWKEGKKGNAFYDEKLHNVQF